MTIQVYEEPPKGFDAKLDVVTCFIEAEKKMLILKRSPGTFEEGLWCLPGGKVNEKELVKEAVIREILEETGLFLSPNTLEKIGILYISNANFQYHLHVFYFSYPKVPDVLLDKEHEEAKWLTIEDMLKMPLISSGEKVVEFYLKMRSKLHADRIHK